MNFDIFMRVRQKWTVWSQFYIKKWNYLCVSIMSRSVIHEKGPDSGLSFSLHSEWNELP